jgi:hypothetical protein
VKCAQQMFGSARDSDSVRAGLCTRVKDKPWIASGSFLRNGHGPTDCSTLRSPEFALRAVVLFWAMLVIACSIFAQRVCWIHKRLLSCLSHHPSPFILHPSHCTLRTSHFSPHLSHSTLYTEHSNTSHYLLHTPRFTLHTKHCTLHTTPFIHCIAKCALHTSHGKSDTHHRVHVMFIFFI